VRRPLAGRRVPRSSGSRVSELVDDLERPGRLPEPAGPVPWTCRVPAPLPPPEGGSAACW
jgi:hypothetical protein